MRRFIASLPGKVIGQLVILALLMPTLTLALMARASAQVAQLPVWAVVEFTNRKSVGTSFGKNAAAAVIGELAKTGRYEVVPQEQIQRAIETLGVDSPPKGTVNLLRVGQEVRATTIVDGNIVDYGVKSVDGGKQAFVTMLVILYDVASGTAVNGVAESGFSTIRPSNTSDEVLINDALAQGASKGVNDILARTLPTATVQNTTTEGAYINQGARSGFKSGQSIIVTRGRQQVGTGHITELDADSAMIKIERNATGGGPGSVQPGDKVRAIFDVPSLLPGVPNNDGSPPAVRRHKSGNPSGLLTVLIVLGIVAILLSSGNSGGQNAAENVKNEALNDPTLGANSSGVLISWGSNGFYNGQQQQYRWQIYRSDVGDVPIQFAPGSARSARNTSDLTTETFPYLQRGIAGGVDCNQNASSSTALVQPVITGRPYTYSVELVYRVLNLDLPDGGSAGATTGTTSTSTTATGTTSTGSTATGTTSTGTTGTTTTGSTATGTTSTGTTGTTTTGTTSTGTNTTGTTQGQGYVYCYFTSERQSASGPATPLQRPVASAPASGSQLSGGQVFTFTAVGSVLYPAAIEYTLEFSTTVDFQPGTWVTAAKQVVSRVVAPTTALTFPSVDVSSSQIPAAIRNGGANGIVYWRVGARNVIDRPGPTPSINGQRYVYSYPPNSFRPASAPPGGP